MMLSGIVLLVIGVVIVVRVKLEKFLIEFVLESWYVGSELNKFLLCKGYSFCFKDVFKIYFILLRMRY